MAAANSTGGGTWRPVQFCSGDPALLCGHRAFSRKFLPGTWQIARKIESLGRRCRIRLEALCASAATRTGPPIRAISFGGRTERSGSASGSGARVAGRRRRFTFPIADGFLERERDRGAGAGSSRFFRARLSSALRGRHSFTVKYALERAGAVSVSVLRTETGAGRSASVGRWRPAISGVFVLPGGMGVPADRLSGMRGRELREASGLHGGRTQTRPRGRVRQLPELYKDGGHDQERAGRTDRG